MNGFEIIIVMYCGIVVYKIGVLFLFGKVNL